MEEACDSPQINQQQRCVAYFLSEGCRWDPNSDADSNCTTSSYCQSI